MNLNDLSKECKDGFELQDPDAIVIVGLQNDEDKHSVFSLEGKTSFFEIANGGIRVIHQALNDQNVSPDFREKFKESIIEAIRKL